jgi:xyloglucan-specific exo-beta-1,4-glucanase
MKLMRASLVLALLAGGAGAAAGAPGATDYAWDSVAIGGGGFVTAVIPSRTEPGVIYARTDVGGAYRWDHRAGRWQPMLDWVSEDQTGYLGIDALAIDPKNAANLYLLAGTSYLNDGKTAILRSSDHGKTFAATDVTAQFKTHGNGMGRQSGERPVVDPGSSKVLYVGTRWNGLFRSADAGRTWARLPSLAVTTTPNDVGIGFVVPDPASVASGLAQRLFVGVSRFGAQGPSFYRSNDGGASFGAVPGAPTALIPQRAALDGSGNLYVTYANGAGPHPNQSRSEPMNRGQIWKYHIGSGAWLEVTPAGWSTPFAGVSVDPANPRRVVASTINTYAAQGDAHGDRIFVTSDGGASWTDVIARGFVRDGAGVPWVAGHAIHWAGSVEFDPFDPRAVWVTSGNGVFRTANIDATPATWTFTSKGLEETVPLGLVSIPGAALVSAIGDYDGFLHADASRYGQVHRPAMGTTTGLDVAAAQPATMVRVGAAMYYTLDAGASWRKTATLNGKLGQVALSADGRTILHSPQGSATSYRSTDFGASWTPVRGLASANLRPVADPADRNTFYAYDHGAVLASTDGGVTFTARSTLAAGGSRAIRLAPGRAGDLWVALNGGGLARSLDGGARFQLLPNVSHCGAVGFGKAAPGNPYPTVYIWGTVNGVRGVYRSTDSGASWLRINDDAHQYGGPGNGQFIVGDMNTFGVVYMSTAGRGIVYGSPRPDPGPGCGRQLRDRRGAPRSVAGTGAARVRDGGRAVMKPPRENT